MKVHCHIVVHFQFWVKRQTFGKGIVPADLPYAKSWGGRPAAGPKPRIHSAGPRYHAASATERAPAGRHAALLNERAARGCHAAPLHERPPPFDHGRVVRPRGPAIEIAPMGLRPVVRLHGRCLYHLSMKMDDRPQVTSPVSCVSRNSPPTSALRRPLLSLLLAQERAGGDIVPEAKRSGRRRPVDQFVNLQKIAAFKPPAGRPPHDFASGRPPRTSHASPAPRIYSAAVRHPVGCPPTTAAKLVRLARPAAGSSLPG